MGLYFGVENRREAVKTKKIATYAICIAVTEAIGFLSGMLNRQATDIYANTIIKPVLSPQGIVFPIAWTILYALMAIGLAMVILSQASKDRTKGIIFYVIQLAFNFVWSFLFFGFQMFGVAFIWLLALLIFVIFMTLAFKKVSKTAAMLQIPYLCWLLFAGYLNAGVWVLNR